eukprot:TRINITY_DN7727_c0_g1_i2.p1 TRINITY_DN7727_c0_g1~~TRINITY_DN7727_c0_g1_i2.p1  ORF type:complete len:213 (+),score=53.00 TRINITY_DN7727_c0_g1_i2:764-1402(+)
MGCYYSHVVESNQDCQFGFACVNRAKTCPYKHPSEACRFGMGCYYYTSCFFSHATPCQFGSSCKTPGCPLAHAMYPNNQGLVLLSQSLPKLPPGGSINFLSSTTGITPTLTNKGTTYIPNATSINTTTAASAAVTTVAATTTATANEITSMAASTLNTPHPHNATTPDVMTVGVPENNNHDHLLNDQHQDDDDGNIDDDSPNNLQEDIVSLG